MTWTDPTDAELHAYADDQLSPEGRARVADWLAEHPAAAAELAAWRAQNDAIRALFAPYATAGPADGLLIAAPQRAWPRRAAIATAAVMIFVLGALGGHFAPPPFGPPHPAPVSDLVATLPQQAQSAFLVYASDPRRPVEVFADEEAQLARWLGKRLEIPDLKIPNLQTLGFTLIGGRLLAMDENPGAMFIYETATGERLSLIVGRNAENRVTGFRFASAGALETFYWIDGALGYAVTGEIPRDLLRQIAEECYSQFGL